MGELDGSLGWNFLSRMELDLAELMMCLSVYDRLISRGPALQGS